MRLNRIKQRYNSSDAYVDTLSEDVIGKGMVSNHAVNWMKTYFRKHYEVMPTSGKFHLPDNYICDELYIIYKQEMEAQKERYVHYSYFTRLWNVKFDHVMIP
jgi:hypothetical protein